MGGINAAPTDGGCFIFVYLEERKKDMNKVHQFCSLVSTGMASFTLFPSSGLPKDVFDPNEPITMGTAFAEVGKAFREVSDLMQGAIDSAKSK
ncbi:hypothetical protein AGMMS49938_03850 [Fibrobacterales bacterium]|nr:hypothetical protein AGMMS49938_03850 [Fibrobacterales bacterium]